MASSIITADDFLIERPFGPISSELYEEWFDAAKLFVVAHDKFDDESTFIAAINDCFPSLMSHAYNYDQHISGGKKDDYAAARSGNKEGKYNSDKTRAFLLLEKMFEGFAYNPHPLIPKPDITLKRIRIPSPLLFLRRLLTSDEFLASEAYSHAIIRAEIFASTVRSFPPDKEINLFKYVSKQINHQSVSDALNKFVSYHNRRESTYLGKPIDFIVGNYLASLGLANLSFSRESVKPKPSRNEYKLFSIDEFLSQKSLDIHPNQTENKRDDFGYEIKLTVSPNDIPSIPHILNDLEGIAFPVSGARTVFAGGVRMTDHGGAVIRISGKSGSGKTSLALAACVGLAPLGTETYYLSCEEEQDDLLDRISSITPPFVSNTRTYTPPSFENDASDSWFHPYHLDNSETQTNFDEAVAFVEQVRQKYKENKIEDPKYRPPGTVPYIVVLDGIHELVDRSVKKAASDNTISGNDDPISSLHDLVETYRKLNVIVILVSAAVDSPTFNSLDYLVDVVVDLDTGQSVDSPHKPLRTASLTKTRRQFSNTGSHKFHISKKSGVRFYPNLEASLEQFKAKNWQQPDERFHFDFATGPNSFTGTNSNFRIFSKSHILVAGKGSGGKAGFALRLLSSPLIGLETPSKRLSFEGSASDETPIRRCLIISFLYPETYYDGLISKIEGTTHSNYTASEAAPDFQYSVLTFFPGYVAPEVLVTKIADRIRAAELKGAPIDSVMLDGLHNVFLQFPLLEKSTLIWPMLSEMFRRLGLNVIITHSHFDVIGMNDSPLLASDVSAAAHRSTPLLQALVNSADYYFDVSIDEDADNIAKRPDKDNLYAIKVATAFGQAVPRSAKSTLYWNREAMQIIHVGSD